MPLRTLLRVVLPISILIAGLALTGLVLMQERRIARAEAELRSFHAQLEGKSAALATVRELVVLRDKSVELCDADRALCIDKEVFSQIYRLAEEDKGEITRVIFTHPDAQLTFANEEAARRVEKRLIAHSYPARTQTSPGSVVLHVGKQR